MNDDFVDLGSDILLHVNCVKALVDTINNCNNTNYTFEEIVDKYKSLDLKLKPITNTFINTTTETVDVVFKGLSDLLKIFNADTDSSYIYWYKQYKKYEEL